jgi:hypothetical protein
LKTLDVSFLHLLDYTYVFFIRLAHLNLACTSCDVSIARYPNTLFKSNNKENQLGFT